MLTARKDEPDRIRGLSLGADDYLTKAAFSPPELVLRVGAILQRLQDFSRPADRRRTTRRAVLINRAAHRVSVEGSDVEPTPTEFKLLLMLAERHPGRAFVLQPSLMTVWEAAPDIKTRTVDMHIRRLRSKLGAAGPLIETVRGFGYRMKPASARRVRLRGRLIVGALAVIAVQVIVVVLLVQRQLSSSLRLDAVAGLA